MATSAPALARARAISRPMRRAPPLTSADLPWRGTVGIALSESRFHATVLKRRMRDTAPRLQFVRGWDWFASGWLPEPEGLPSDGGGAFDASFAEPVDPSAPGPLPESAVCFPCL